MTHDGSHASSGSLKKTNHHHEVVIWSLLYGLLITALLFTWKIPDDEGFFTWFDAKMLWSKPWASLFMQKLKPSGAILYAVPVLLGSGPFFVFHGIVHGFCTYFLGMILVGMNRRPEGGLLLLSSSPVFLLCGVTYQTNSAGVFYLLAVIYFLEVQRMPMLAGLLAGMLPWARYEFILYVPAFLYLGWRRQELPRFLAGVVAFPMCYWWGGALYHRSILWMLDFPPTLSQALESNPTFEIRDTFFWMLGTVCSNLGMTSLGWVFVLFAPFRKLPEVLQALIVTFLVLLVLMTILPLLGGVLNFDLSPRYWTVFLPVIALVAGYVLGSEKRIGGQLPYTPSILLGVGLFFFLLGSWEWMPHTFVPALPFVVAGVLLLWERHGKYLTFDHQACYLRRFTLAGQAPWSRPIESNRFTGKRKASFDDVAEASAQMPLSRRMVFAGGLIVAATASAFALPDRHWHGFSGDKAQDERRIDLLKEFIEIESGVKTLFIDSKEFSYILEPWLQARGIPLFILPGFDIIAETYHLTNPANGQQEAIFESFREDLLGTPVFPCDLRSMALEPGMFFLISEDDRTLKAWSRILESRTRHVKHLMGYSLREVQSHAPPISDAEWEALDLPIELNAPCE